MQREDIAMVHEGRNVRRIREMLGIKQEALAMDLGLSQQGISSIEQREVLDRDLLERVATALKVSPEAIKNFNEQAVVNNISCNFHDSPNSASVFYNFSPVEKLMEVMEENKKLYEALLKSEREMIALLERMLNERK